MMGDDERRVDPGEAFKETDSSVSVQHSSVGAMAQGPNAQASATVNNFGLGYADVAAIVDERVTGAVDRLRAAVGDARNNSIEDMLRISFTVVLSLVGTKLGTKPDASAVAAFLQRAVDDATFPARAARLFQEGIKTPSPDRRRMLATALFGIPRETPERDRIDAAIERLFPTDVALLADLIKFSLPYLLLAESPDGKLFIIREEERRNMLWEQTLPVSQLDCDAHALHNLAVTGCIKLDAKVKGLGPERRYSLTAIYLLPLGHAIVSALAAVAAKGTAL
jgi:hypothetical protein